jgi:hypothetical protein
MSEYKYSIRECGVKEFGAARVVLGDYRQVEARQLSVSRGIEIESGAAIQQGVRKPGSAATEIANFRP